MEPLYFFFAPDVAFEVATGFSSPALGASPITPLSGQILKAGHFAQPVTMAMGQSVTADSYCEKDSIVLAGAGGRVRRPGMNLPNICQISAKYLENS